MEEGIFKYHQPMSEFFYYKAIDVWIIVCGVYLRKVIKNPADSASLLDGQPCAKADKKLTGISKLELSSFEFGKNSPKPTKIMMATWMYLRKHHVPYCSCVSVLHAPSKAGFRVAKPFLRESSACLCYIHMLTTSSTVRFERPWQQLRGIRQELRTARAR